MYPEPIRPKPLHLKSAATYVSLQLVMQTGSLESENATQNRHNNRHRKLEPRGPGADSARGKTTRSQIPPPEPLHLDAISHSAPEKFRLPRLLPFPC